MNARVATTIGIIILTTGFALTVIYHTTGKESSSLKAEQDLLAAVKGDDVALAKKILEKGIGTSARVNSTTICYSKCGLRLWRSFYLRTVCTAMGRIPMAKLP